MTRVRYGRVPGWPRYKVGTDGSVFSKRGRAWRRLRPTRRDRRGYLVVTLYGPGRRQVVYVHRLVLLAFAGPCPSGMQTRHLNGRPGDNRLRNVRYGTRRENAEDRVRHGRSNRGERNPGAKLSDDLVRMIRLMDIEEEIPPAEIAAFLGVGERTVRDVLRGETWKHVA